MQRNDSCHRYPTEMHGECDCKRLFFVGEFDMWHVAASKYVVHYNTKVNGTYKNTGKKQSMTGIGIAGPG